ncbi:MAG: EamA family transporter [Acidobacteriota bacterium]
MQAVKGNDQTGRRNTIMLIAAFAAVYLIWGSTYLAIKYAIGTIPSFMMAGVRFSVAGITLLIWARLSPSYQRPKPVHVRTAVIVGALLLALGNGGVVIAEQYLSSSLTALLIATVPFLIVILSWAFMGAGRPRITVVLGLIAGFVGVTLLVLGQPAGDAAGTGSRVLGIIALAIATIGWAIGSLYGSRAESAKPNTLAAGMQMVSGGIMLLIMSAVRGEWAEFHLSAVSTTSLAALAYLIFFGALIAYTAYNWLLQNASPATVSTYAYINPAIAVVLGWSIAGETLTGQMLVGAAIIVGSVVLITSQKRKKRETVGEEKIGRSDRQSSETQPATATA